jgi:hypothetical protein
VSDTGKPTGEAIREALAGLEAAASGCDEAVRNLRAFTERHPAEAAEFRVFVDQMRAEMELLAASGRVLLEDAAELISAAGAEGASEAEDWLRGTGQP